MIKNVHDNIQENQFHLFVRAGESQPFILKVKVPDNRNDTCSYKGVDTYDSLITADIQLCPSVVRLLCLIKKSSNLFTLNKILCLINIIKRLKNIIRIRLNIIL